MSRIALFLMLLTAGFLCNAKTGRLMEETTIEGSVMVRDTVTSLIWAKNFEVSISWEEAKNQCTALKLGGARGWRLPTIAELKTLVNTDRMQPATDFKDMSACRFWSAEPFLANKQKHAKYIDFADGSEGNAQAGAHLCSRCVR